MRKSRREVIAGAGAALVGIVAAVSPEQAAQANEAPKAREKFLLRVKIDGKERKPNVAAYPLVLTIVEFFDEKSNSIMAVCYDLTLNKPAASADSRGVIRSYEALLKRV
jgi:hypothetical protein